jgi:hypothetical protein
MIRPLGKFVLTLGALALLASPAWAQGRGGFGGGAYFLMAPNVQKDLKLSDEQIGKVQDTLRATREKHADEFAALRDLPQEERPAKAAALNKTVAVEVKTALALSDEQSKRFDQIALQARGLQVFFDPSIQEKLQLTDDQKSKLREIARASQGQGGGANFKDASEEEKAAIVKRMNETRKENMAKGLAVLTDDQKKTWKDLTGVVIEIQFQRRPTN